MAFLNGYKGSKHGWRSPLLLLVSAICLTLLLSSQATADDNDLWVEGEYILQIREGAIEELKSEIHELHQYSDEDVEEAVVELVDAKVTQYLELVDSKVVKTDGGEPAVENAVMLLDAKVFNYVEPNYKWHVNKVPNDLDSRLWGMHNTGQTGGTSGMDIDAPEAWDTTTGSSNVIIGVVDTGVDYNHPDLVANMWKNPGEIPGNNVDDDGNGYVDDVYGWNGRSGENASDPNDDNNHGTHCAGTIAGVGDNGTGVVGVNWNAKIMALRFLGGSSGSGSTSGAITVINYALKIKQQYEDQPMVLSNSWGGGGHSSALLAAIQQANDLKVLFVAAAGNAGRNSDQTTYYPQGYDVENVVSVAALDHNGNKASFSNYGATSVDLGAPGVDIRSTVRGGGYAHFNGTSMATPHVSGVAALVLAQKPALAAKTLKDLLMNTVQQIDSLSGYMVAPGMLNARNALFGEANSAPVLSPIGNQAYSHKQSSATVALSASDEEGDPISFNAEIVEGGSDVLWNLDQSYNFWTDGNYNVGSCGGGRYSEKYIRGRPDGYSYDLTYFILSSGRLYRYYSCTNNLLYASFITTLPTSAYSNPRLLTDPTQAFNPPPTATVNGTNLQLNWQQGQTGKFSVRVTATAIGGSDTETFEVDIQNQAPVVAPISNKIMSPNDDYLDVPLTYSDPDGDELTVTASLPGNESAISLSISGNTLRIDPQGAFEGTFTVTVSATDGNLTTNRSFTVTVTNRAPTIDPISDVTVVPGTITKNVAYSVSDPDGDTLIVTARIGQTPSSLAYQLDQQYNFTRTGNNDFQDAAGRGTRFVRSQVGGQSYFFITESGAFHRWTGRAATSPKLAQLDASYYDDLNKLIDVENPLEDPPLTLSVTGTHIVVNPRSGFVGTARIIVQVSDGKQSVETSFNFSVSNTAPVLSDFSDISVGVGTSSTNVPYTTSDEDSGDTVTVSAEVRSAASEAYRLDQAHDWEVAPDFYNNFTGHNEKFVIGNAFWAFILPNGKVYRWLGSWNTSQPLGELNETYHSNLEKMINVADPAINPEIAITVESDKLVLSPRSDFVGTVTIVVTATDGKTPVSKSFNYTVVNQKPVLAAIANVSVAPGATNVNVPYSTSDADSGDSVTVTATLLEASNPAELTIAVNANALVINPRNDFAGTKTIRVRASDGREYVERTFTFTVTNNAPTFADIADITMNWAEGTRVVPFSVSDADGQSLTVTASLDSPAHTAYNLDQQKNFRRAPRQYDNLNGHGEKYLIGNDGWYLLIGRNLYYWTGNINTVVYVATLDDSYWHNPGKLIDVEDPSTNPVATLSVSGSTVSISPRSDYMGTFSVLLRASDGMTTSSKSFRVTVTNGAPVLSPIADQTITTDENSKSISVNVIDPDGESVTLTASIINDDTAAYALDQQHNFSVARADYFQNLNGRNERYLAAQDMLLVLMPDGTACRWTGDINTCAFIRRFAVKYWQNPELLVDVPEPTSVDLPATLAVSGTNLTIARKDGFLGSFTVTVVASDGKATDTESFNVRVVEPSNQALDTDGDGTSDEQELEDGTNPYDAGSFIPHLNQTIYTLWNSFLNMINILELINPGLQDVIVKVTFLDSDGNVASVHNVNVPANGQFDLILNDLVGWKADAVGLVKIEIEELIDGRMFYYSLEEDSDEHNFGFGIPLSNYSTDDTAVSFNTFQPSLKPSQRDNQVANWLTMVNLENEEKEFLVETYNQPGELLASRKVTVPAGGRRDIDGGQGIAGPNVVGLHLIKPLDKTAKYLAQLIRYGGNAPAGVAPTDYDFAFPLVAQAGNGEEIHIPISRMMGGDNWVEVVNTLGMNVDVEATVHNSTGVVYEDTLKLNPHAQIHLNAVQHLGDEETGFITLKGNAVKSIIANSMFYYRRDDGSISAMYGSQARQALGNSLFGSTNFFLGMKGFLRIANTSDESVELTVTTTGPRGIIANTLVVPPLASTNLELHDHVKYGTAPNTYGIVTVRATNTEQSVNIYAELLRTREANGELDFTAPTPVR